jgi:hypothetical protein
MNLSGALNSLAVGLGFLTLLRRWARRRTLLPSASGRAFALFLLVCILSIPGSIDPIVGVKEWARLASGLAIYLMVVDVVNDERDARRFVVVILVSSLLPLALAWIQRITGQGYFFLGFVGTDFAYRPRGTFAHPAALGSYLIVLLAMSASLIFTATSPRIRATVSAWVGVAATTLVLTLARAQWLGMMVTALVMGLLKRRALALLALAVAVLLLATVPFLRERLTASDSVIWRLDLWQAGKQLAASYRLGTRPRHVAVAHQPDSPQSRFSSTQRLLESRH